MKIHSIYVPCLLSMDTYYPELTGLQCCRKVWLLSAHGY